MAVAAGETLASNLRWMGGIYRRKKGPRLPMAVCDCCSKFRWFRFQVGSLCGACGAGWFIDSDFWIFYECPHCSGAWLGCECDHGLVAVPREQTMAGDWMIFSEADDRGCVCIVKLDFRERQMQAISDRYPWP
jgi:hypothetical protein